jgi:hypothetical protein
MEKPEKYVTIRERGALVVLWLTAVCGSLSSEEWPKISSLLGPLEYKMRQLAFPMQVYS